MLQYSRNLPSEKFQRAASSAIEDLKAIQNTLESLDDGNQSPLFENKTGNTNIDIRNTYSSGKRPGSTNSFNWTDSIRNNLESHTGTIPSNDDGLGFQPKILYQGSSSTSSSSAVIDGSDNDRKLNLDSLQKSTSIKPFLALNVKKNVQNTPNIPPTFDPESSVLPKYVPYSQFQCPQTDASNILNKYDDIGSIENDINHMNHHNDIDTRYFDISKNSLYTNQDRQFENTMSQSFSQNIPLKHEILTPKISLPISTPSTSYNCNPNKYPLKQRAVSFSYNQQQQQQRPNAEKSIILERAEQEYEDMLRRQRDSALNSLRDMLRIGAETYLRENQETLDAHHGKRDASYITQLLIEAINKRATALFTANATSHTNANVTVRNQNDSIHNRTMNGGDTSEESSVISDITNTGDYLPEHLQKSVQETLESYKRKLLEQLERELHREASVSLRSTQVQAEERRKYWIDLARSDVIVTNNKCLRAAQSQEDPSHPFPSSHSSTFPHSGYRHTSASSSKEAHTAAHSSSNIRRQQSSDANQSKKLFPDEDTELLADTLSQSSQKSTQEAADSSHRSRGADDASGQFYLHRARRGKERVVGSLIRMLDEMSNIAGVDAAQLLPDRALKSKSTNSENDIKDSVPHMNTRAKQRSESTVEIPIMDSWISNVLECSESVAKLPVSTLGNRTFESVSLLRHVALILELSVQKHEQLAEKLKFEYNYLKSNLT